ncbi:MAG TPA: cellulose synthase catalytic subunit [Streptosporangiaceae bacterium]|nr:cellulose synthase catalytic subunit [Streptosporangiaceae bacterium]
MSTDALSAGRYRPADGVLPKPPTDAEKASYAWRSLPLLTCAVTLSSLCVVVAQAWLETRFLVALPFAIYTFMYFAYQALSIPVNFTGRSFDLQAHELRCMTWRPARYPTVDIFLPICGEPLDVLRNTWKGVARLRAAYPGEVRPYVLDDGDSDEAAQLAQRFGFGYIRRPVHEHKKAGNLNYAFPRTRGEHVVIFDADFRPRPDFLAETLPYMDDPWVGIVQTPQFFRVDKDQTWVEKAAGATLEVFYRSVQQARDRFGSALCVGSNAVYRREALERAGGFTLIPYAEDSHTGLDMRYQGYELVYVPVPLAAGVCPATIDLFMRQQYRWCCGATSLIWTRHMWRVQMPFRSRLPYIAGWLWNLTTAMRAIFLPLIPVVLLALLPGEIQLRNAILLIPTVVTGTLLYPLWHNTRWPIGTWPLAIAVGWAQALSLWDYSRGKVMSWQASRGPGDASRRFRKMVFAWNGTLALAWLALAGYRIAQTGSNRFAIVAFFGVINLIVVGRIIFPGKEAR